MAALAHPRTHDEDLYLYYREIQLCLYLLEAKAHYAVSMIPLSDLPALLSQISSALVRDILQDVNSVT
jgi:hypothetical protein